MISDERAHPFLDEEPDGASSNNSEETGPLLPLQERTRAPVVVKSIRTADDLDLFFVSLYGYFENKGYQAILFSRLANRLSVFFTIALSSFLLLWMDWTCLRTTCARDAKRCQVLRDCVKAKPLCDNSFTTNALMLAYLSLAGASFCWNVLKLLHDLPELREIRNFCGKKLGIERDREFWNIT